MTTPRLSIRVYALILNDARDALLLCDEKIFGTPLTKFPGGGLEFGEGTVECCKREALEELGRPIEILEHLYTTDIAVMSAFEEDCQVVPVYYLARFESPYGGEVIANEPGIKLHWVPLAGLKKDVVTVETDQRALATFIERHQSEAHESRLDKPGPQGPKS